MTETILANATLILPGEAIRGSLCLYDGRIAAVDSGGMVPAGAIDGDGDLVMPGDIRGDLPRGVAAGPADLIRVRRIAGPAATAAKHGTRVAGACLPLPHQSPPGMPKRMYGCCTENIQIEYG